MDFQIPEEDAKELIEFNNIDPSIELLLKPPVQAAPQTTGQAHSSSNPFDSQNKHSYVHQNPNSYNIRDAFNENQRCEMSDYQNVKRQQWKKRLLDSGYFNTESNQNEKTNNDKEKREMEREMEREKEREKDRARARNNDLESIYQRYNNDHDPENYQNPLLDENDLYGPNDNSDDNNTSKHDLYNDNDEFDPKKGCIICQSNFTNNDEITVLPCAHRFHTCEIATWFESNSWCPTCNFPIDSRLYLTNQSEQGTNQLEQLEQSERSEQDTIYNPGAIFADQNLGTVITLLCRVYSIRDQKSMIFFVLKYHENTVQGLGMKKTLIIKNNESISNISVESIVRVQGTLLKSPAPIKSSDITFTDREIHIQSVEIISKSETLPIQISDLNWYTDIGQNTCLNNRVLDLRSRKKQAIFQLQSYMTQYMREFLYSVGFIEIHTPKLTSVSSEGGADVFQTTYFGKPAYLTQSPQLYKQMAINSDFPRIFEIGPVFRAEKSNTKRHLTEFTGFDLEMRIENTYEEILDLFYELLSTTFSKLYQKHSQLIFESRGSKSFELELKKCIISYEDAVKLLNNHRSNENGEDDPLMSPFDDLSHAQEYKLGILVKQIFHTDLFILDKFPMKLRPFYTMPEKDCNNHNDSTSQSDSDDIFAKRYSNSYDIIFRGQEILSGAQRIHNYDDLIAMARAKGLSQESIDNMSFYFNSFKYGSFPHGGGGFGLERVLGNFLGIDEIRMVSMFPRDPKRIEP